MFWKKKKDEVVSFTTEGTASGINVKADPNDAAVLGPFSMMVEDVFAIKGRGVVATGKITSGVIKTGDPLSIRRADGSTVECTCAGVEMFRSVLNEARAGDNVGILLKGVEKEDVCAEDVITARL